MDLAAVQTALTSWIETFSGLQVEWGRQPTKWRPADTAYVLAFPETISPVGWDEPTYSYDDLTDSLNETMVGLRTMVLRLSFRSSDQRMGSAARQAAENFRILIHSQASVDTLNDANIGFISAATLQDTDYEWSGRMVSQVDMELSLHIRARLLNPQADGSYIRSVTIGEQDYVVTEAGELVIDQDGNPVVTEDTDTFTVDADEEL
jgi:hypothetical protein